MRSVLSRLLVSGFVFMASYVPLWCKSNFSFLEGASHPDELVEHAHELGLSSMALTDRDGVWSLCAHQGSELGLKLIVRPLKRRNSRHGPKSKSTHNGQLISQGRLVPKDKGCTGKNLRTCGIILLRR